MATLTPSSEDARIYEVCVLLPHPLSQKESSDAQRDIEHLFGEADGKQIAKDVWGRRGLAYKIGGFDEGTFIVYYYEFPPEKVQEVDQGLRIMQQVLRHIIVKPPKGYEVVTFSTRFEEWLKEQEVAEEVQKKAKEEDLRKKMLAKQKRQAAKKAKEEEKPAAPAAPAADGGKITEEIEKLISTDDIEI